MVIDTPNDIKYELQKAIHYATTGRKGTVFLEIPLDMQSAIINENELREFSFSEKVIFEENSKIDILLSLLNSSTIFFNSS